MMTRRLVGHANPWGRPTSGRSTWRAALLVPSVLVATSLSAKAQDATWNSTATVAGPTAGTFDFDANANWTPGTVPTGTAFFGGSTTTAISFSANSTFGGWTFSGGAPAYSFTNNQNQTFNGAGIVNGSNVTILNKFYMSFSGAATAGAATVTNNDHFFLNNTATLGNSNFTNYGQLLIHNSSSAGNATLVNNYTVDFFDTTTAANSTIQNNFLLQFHDNSTAGNSTITSKSGLTQTSFYDSSTLGNASITNNANLLFNGATTAASGTITTNTGGVTSFQGGSSGGSVRLIFNGGTVDFSGLGSAGTTVGSIEGAGAFILGAKSLTVGGNNQSTSFSGSIQDVGGSGGGSGGSLTKVGTGTLLLSSANSYTGGTTISAGTIGIVADNNLGAATGALTFNGGTLLFGASFNLASTRTITLQADGIIDTGGFSTTISQSMSSSGALIKNGAGTLTLAGANAYTGGTFVNAGTLALSGAGTLGATANTVTVAGGTLDLGGTTQTQNGGVHLTSGTIQNGVLSSAGTFDVQSGVVSAALVGAGALVKSTAGAVTLSGNNTYTGSTTVNGGTLAVNGSIAASTVTVNNGATLAGIGTVGATTINNGGTLAPGAGTLTVQGNLVLSSAAAYLVQISSTGAGRTNVTGTATLGGTAQVTLQPGSVGGSNVYTVLHANGGRSGTFSSVSITGISNFTTNVSYTANDVLLGLTAVLGVNTALGPNQQNVANTLNTYFNSGGALPPGFVTVFGLTGNALGNALTQLSGQIGTGSQQVTFDAMNQFMGVMTDPFIAGRDDPISGGGNPNAYADESMAYAARGNGRPASERDAYAAIYAKAPPRTLAFEQRWSVWAAGFGGSQRTDGNTTVGTSNTSSNLYGVAVGADYRISPNTIAGFALSGGGTNFNVNGFGSGRSDLFQAGGFVRHNVGAAYLTGALAYGWQDITTNRTLTIAGIDQLRAQFNANAWSGRVEGGYRFVTQGFGVTPYAAGQFTTFELPNYMEQAVTGSNQFALAYNAWSVTDTRSELGLRTDKSFAAPDGILTLRGRFAWAHDFNPDRNIAATFQTLPGASFVVNGAAMASDSALVTASVEKKWLSGWSASATFEGTFSNVTESYAGKGVVRYAW